MSTHNYVGTTALITGASKGIGQSLAHDLSKQGADLVLVARSAERLDELASQVRSASARRVETIAADLADHSAPQKIAHELRDRGVTVELLINNAGMGAVGPFLDRPFAPNQYSVDLNISALMGMTYEFGRAMLSRGRGGIINVGSVAGFQPLAFQASYSASKAFVVSFTEALAEELRGTGVRVMAAHPGPVATGFFDSTTAAIDAKAVTPDHIAGNILEDYARGRALSFPGRSSDKATTFVSRILPRSAVARIAGRVNRKNGYDHVGDVTAGDTTM